MGIKPSLREMHRDMGAAFSFIEQIAQTAVVQELEIKRLQARVASLEDKNCSK